MKLITPPTTEIETLEIYDYKAKPDRIIKVPGRETITNPVIDFQGEPFKPGVPIAKLEIGSYTLYNVIPINYTIEEDMHVECLIDYYERDYEHI